ncbi:MAG: hypothetical protein A3J93_04895 [Candidatus Magasanikbacteria bacterium RIFOXYC2_FULL_42_28]|uniref:Uncharacterized protein n=1 Tax=Candidatus Magasanikbacteria bacterium RIFOXYC2_FULL_42_28 TaxID=1798704 RepID=A0A1F6NWV2_9BACT|nr:MAG: hypothetical protein A3J93_04895 [Candidatus Magasanikbacteria bacterium RIFOXYC2_FULL_42_28]
MPNHTNLDKMGTELGTVDFSVDDHDDNQTKQVDLGDIGDISTVELNLPHTQPLSEQEERRIVDVDFIFEHQGKKWKGNIRYERQRWEDGIILDFTIDTLTNERALCFQTSILPEGAIKSSTRQNSTQYKHLLPISRFVAPEYRHQGLGELGFKYIEKTVKRLGELHPDFKVGAIDLDTSLASVAKLLLSPNFLRKNGFEKFANEHRDMGYVLGDEENIENLKAVLEEGVEAFADRKGQKSAAYVHLVKKIL